MRIKYKRLSTLVFAIMFFSCMNHSVHAEEAKDSISAVSDGTIRISTADELMAFADRVNGGETTLNGILANDIDMRGRNWPSIGISGKVYHGIFDGRGYTIRNLTGTNGLFAENQGTVKNVYIKDANISGGRDNIGAVVGHNLNARIIFGCISDGSIAGVNYSIGGIAGWNEGGTISGCVSYCTVRGKTAGGLVGSNFETGKMNTCYCGLNIVEGDKDWGQAASVNAYYKEGTAYKQYYPSENVTEEMVQSVINKFLIENGGYFQINLADGTVKKNGIVLVEASANLTGIYGQKLSDVALPAAGWTWEDEDTLLTVGSKDYGAVFDTSAYEAQYYFTGVTGYDPAGKKVKSSFMVEVFKADSMITIKTGNMDKQYDKKAISSPEFEKTGSTETVTFGYQQYVDGGWKDITSAPANAGTYRVNATVAEDTNYKGKTSEWKEFMIIKAIPQFVILGNLTGAYGSTLSSVALPAYDNGILAWKDGNTVAGTLGTHEFEAIYTPYDTVNYETVTLKLSVEIVPAAGIINRMPETTTNKKDSDRNSTNSLDAPDTGDRADTELYAFLFSVSGMLAALLAILKKALSDDRREAFFTGKSIYNSGTGRMKCFGNTEQSYMSRRGL